MDRQEAMICIAKMNRYSRLINSCIETGTTIDLKCIAPEIGDVCIWGEDILEYLNKNPSCGLVNEISLIRDASKLSVYLRHNDKLRVATKAFLKEFIQTVTKLQDYAEKYMKQYRKGPYEKLVNELAYKEAKDVFIKIKDAGFIDEDFKLKKSTTRIQTALLAWSIIKSLKLPRRRSWAVIERQWECGRLGGIPFPEQKTNDMEKVKSIFPEVDYSTLFAKPTEQQFEVSCGEDVLMEVFLTLVTHGFISKKTKFENFMKIFNKANADNFKPVDWIASVRYLTYFVHYAFAKTNRKYLERTRYCFTLKGKPLNKGTLKATASFTLRTDDGNETLAGLKQIALKLAVSAR